MTPPYNHAPEDLIGSYRTFGEEGPLYEIVSQASDGKVHVVVVQTGEEFDYSVEHAIQDPEAK